MPTHYDLIVLGAGSGGIGAALAASRLGASVLLIEKADALGGTATRGGVHCWECGAGGTGIPFDIYCRLRQSPDAVGIYSLRRHCHWPGPDEPQPFPGGESVIDPDRTYVDSLRRHGARSMRDDEAFVREHWHGVVFEPDAYCRVVGQILAETGRCTVLKNTTFVEADTNGRRIDGLTLSNGDKVAASAYVDATGDALLAVAAGCETMVGQEGRDAFDEPDAPEESNDRLNGATLIYRIGPAAAPGVEPLPDGVPAECWWSDSFPGAFMNHYPNGDLNVNVLPMVDGREAFDLGPEATYTECLRRLRAHWHDLQARFEEFRCFRIKWTAPALGVRETRRVVGRYVLTEHDLLAGLSGQAHDDIIAVAEHAMDTHGAARGCGELREPHGIPYRCLLPKGMDNLLVACRAASFSSLAASSCRLSRTMMQLGQAAGTAAVLAKQQSTSPADAPVAELRSALVDQHVELAWPMQDAARLAV